MKRRDLMDNMINIFKDVALAAIGIIGFIAMIVIGALVINISINVAELVLVGLVALVIDVIVVVANVKFDAFELYE